MVPRLYEHLVAGPGDARATLDREESAKELADELEAELGRTKDRARQGRLHYEWARLLEAPLGDFAAALVHYRKAHELCPDQENIVSGLRRVLLVRGDFEAALSWFDHEVRLTGPRETKAELLYEKGLLLEGPLGRASEARKAFEQAHELAPRDAAILRAVVRARRRDQAWAEVDRGLEAVVGTTEGDERLRAARLSERARLAEVKRKDPAASAAFYRLAFDAAADATVALSDLERLHAIGQRPDELARVVEERVAHSSDPAVRGAALELLGRVLDGKLGDVEGAARALERAFVELPAETCLLEELARLHERSGNAAALADVLGRLEERQTDDARRVELRLRLGRLHEESLDRPELAQLHYERARELDPAHPGVVDALVAFYTRRQEWELLAQVYVGLARASRSVVLRAEAEREIAELAEQRLGRKDVAVEHHKRALGLVPGYPPSFRSLTRLFTELGRHVELLELYERGVELGPDDETAFAYLFKMGAIFEDALGDPARAVEIYRRVLARAPSHFGALLALERAAERAGLFDVLVEALEKEASLVDGARQVALLHRAGEVAELRLGDDARALALYKAVLTLDARFAPVLQSLRRLHFAAGRFQELVETYQKELAITKEPPAKAQLFFAMGQVYEVRLARRDAAIAEYKRALEQDPEHGPARHALGLLLEREERYEELAKVLAQQAERTADAADKARVLVRLGDVQENRLGKPNDALQSFDAASKLIPGHRAALEGRVRLLAALGQSRGLARALDEDAESSLDPWTRRAALLRAAEVYRDDLNQPEEAAARYEKVLDEHPRHPEALVALEAIYGELGRPTELGRVLRQQVGAFSQPEHRVASLRELLRLGEAPEEEAAVLQELLTQAPADRRALERAELHALRHDKKDELARSDARLAEEESRPLVAAAHRVRLGEYLEPKNSVQALLAYRRALELDPESWGAVRGVSRIALSVGEAGLLLEAAEGEVRVTHDAARGARLFLEAALRLEEGGDLEAAAQALERALLIHPDAARAAQELLSIRARQGEFDRLVTVLSDAAGRAKDPEVRASHWIAVARTHANQRNDLPAALTALLRVERQDPGHTRTLLELGELYVRDRQFEQAAARFERALSGALSPEELVSVRLRLAELYHEHLDRRVDARRLLGLVLEGAPHHRDALRRMLAIQMSEGASESAQARATAKAWVEATQGAERAEALTTWGRLARDSGELDEARTALEQAVLLVGVGEPGAAADLRVLLRENPKLRSAGGFEAYAAALEGFIQRAGDAREASAASLELGRVYLDELGDATRGFPALERGLRAAPGDRALAIEYAARLQSAGLYERALLQLRALVALEPTRADTWRDLVEVFDALSRNAEAHLAVGPLVLCGGGTDLQKSTWRARQPRPALVAEGSLAGAALEVFGPDAADEATTLLAQLSDLAPKLLGAGWDRVGVAPRERVSPRSHHPLRPIFDRVARAFGTVDLDLYAVPEYEGPVRVLLTDPAGLLVPGSFAALSEAEQVFLLTRFAATIARGVALVDVLDDDALSDWIVASVRFVDPRWGASKSSAQELDALSRRIAKALPWLSKGKFEDAARRYAAAHPSGPEPRGEAFRRAALGTALVVSDDVSPLVLLSRSHGVPVGLDTNENRAAQLELLQLWVGEPAMQLRRFLGFV